MKTTEIDELIARAEAGEQIMVRIGYGPARAVDLDELHLSRGIAEQLEQLSDRWLEEVDRASDLDLCQLDAAQRAGFAKPTERITVTGVFEHLPPCPRC